MNPNVRTAYEDDQSTILQGESLAVLQTLESESVDLVLTDPPYSSGGTFRQDRALMSQRAKYATTDAQHDLADFPGDNRDQRSFAMWATMWLSECWRVLAPGRACAVFTDWRQLPTMTDALQAGGFVWRGIGVWEKHAGRPNMGLHNGLAEYVVWGTKGPTDLGHDVYLPTVMKAAAPHTSTRIHLTEKPLGLLEQLVRLAAPGGLVLDPFLGSGTTLAAARSMGRRGLGIEITDHYASAAANRLRQASIPLVAPDAKVEAPPTEAMFPDEREPEAVEA